MRKKKVIIGVVGFILICIIGVMCFLLNRDKIPTKEEVKESIENTLGETINEEPINVDTPEYVLTLEKLNGYEVLEVEEQDDSIIAKVRVYSPDLYTVSKTLDSTSSEIPIDKMDEIISEALNNAEIISCEINVEIQSHNKGEYFAVLTEKFVDAYYGGIRRLYKEQLLNSWKEMKK